MIFKCDARGRELKSGKRLCKILEEKKIYINNKSWEVPASWWKSIKSDHVLEAIYDENEKCIKTTKGKIYELEKAIYIRNSYDIFYGHFSSFISSYPSEDIQHEKRSKYGLYHNKLEVDDNISESLLFIEDERMRYDYISTQTNQAHLVLSWHIDHGNYWHWHYEVLPRLLIFMDFMEHKRDHVQICLHIVGNKLSGWQIKSIILLTGKNIKIKYHKDGVMLDRSIHVNAPYPATFHEDILCMLRERLKMYNREKAGQILYVPRGIARNGRQLENENQLIGELIKIGAKIFDSGGASYIEQQKEFAGSDIVIMPHGAAFGNALYCNKGTFLIDLHPENYIHPEPLVACHGLGIKYKMIAGDQLRQGNDGQRYRIPIDEILNSVDNYWRLAD